jgi:hypothetical protein
MKVAPMALLFALPFVAACPTVDETGYECTDERADKLFVDETGYLKNDLVWYTAQAALDAAQLVTVIGFPDAICPRGGALEVTGPGTDTPVPVVVQDDGAFFFDVNAAANDELTFLYTLPDGSAKEDALTLNDDLTELDAPSAVGTGSSPPLLTSPDASGMVAVNMSALTTGLPPFVAYNDTTDSGVVISEAGENVEVAGESGDLICVFSINADSSTQSRRYCEGVPAP